jgi:hypothetical protein
MPSELVLPYLVSTTAALPAAFLLCYPYLIFCSLVSKGTGVMMLKVGSKRRRTQTQIEEEKQEAMVKQIDVEAKLASLAAMQEEVARLKVQAESNQSASDILNDLASKQKIFINNVGDVLIPGIDDPALFK